MSERESNMQSKFEVKALNIVTFLVFSSIFHSASSKVKTDMGYLA